MLIPVRIIAIAACEAAKIHGEDCADAFDDGAPSRARLTAIEAIKKAYPFASQASIARHFGLEHDAKRIGNIMECARLSRWWRFEDVDRVASKLMGAKREGARTFDDGQREPRVEIESERADAFTVRSYRPARIIQKVVRPANVTAALLGDPPPGRREMLAAMPDDRGRAAWREDAPKIDKRFYNRGQFR